MAGETWGNVTAEVEFEENPRTIGGFTAVIDEYRRHLDKAVRRNRVRPRNTRAALYFADQIIALEKLNG